MRILFLPENANDIKKADSWPVPIELKARVGKGRSQRGREVVEHHVSNASGQVFRVEAVATDRITRRQF